MKPWTLEEAVVWFRETRPIFQQAGWAAALFGSIFDERPANDLDVLCVEWGSPLTPPAEVALRFRDEHGCQQRDFLDGVFGQAFWLETPRGQIIDLQFRNSPSREARSPDGALLRRGLGLIAEGRSLGPVDDPMAIAQLTLDRYG